MKGKKRTIIHLDLDAFFVAVERLRDPSLIGKPVVVGGNPDGRGVIAAASYEARRYGIHSATPSAKAKKLCPHAIFIRARHNLYSEYSKKFFRIVTDYTPLIEQTSIDEGYIDVTGCEPLQGHPLRLAEEIKLRVKRELGLSVSMGIGSNKLIAKIGSDYAKPEGIVYILPGTERVFLAPMPVEKIPGVGPAVLEKLNGYGIRTIDDLSRMGRDGLEKIFGKHGASLHNASLGIGSIAFGSTFEQAKSVSREHTFGQDTNDISFLEATLCRLSEKATADLREKGLKASTITLKLRYADFKTVTRSHSLGEPTDLDNVIYAAVRGLLGKTYQRRTAVRLIGVSLTHLDEERQGTLLRDERERKMENLYRSVDKIRGKYGGKAVLNARGCLGDV